MRYLIRAAVVAAVAAVAAIGSVAPALANVTVSGTDTQPGGYGVLTFRASNESATASTTELRVILPQSTPIYLVSTQPKDGWTATVTRQPLPAPQPDRAGVMHNDYATQVVWKVNGSNRAIKPGEFDTFAISAGPLPQRPSLPLPVVQVYSDGTTVAWDEESLPGQPAAEHPAPVLALASPQPPAAAAGTEDTATQPAPDHTPVWPGVVALIIAIAALGAAVGNYVMLRRATELVDD